MNRIFMICSSVFLVLAFMRPGYADEHFPFLAEVSKESVNVRAGPNTNFQKVDKLNKGTKVVVLAKSYDWYQIQPLPTTKSFIRSDYLSIKPQENVAVVEGDNVNVRCEASSDAASLGEVKKGTLVKVVEQVLQKGSDQKSGNPGWSRLAPVAGTHAWVNQGFLKEVSADVPASMMIQDVQFSSLPVLVAVQTTKQVTQKISLQGLMQALSQAPSEDVHYEIAIDDKTIFYLMDIPQISFFENKVVTIEGNIIADLQKKYIHPLLHINKISLVL